MQFFVRTLSQATIVLISAFVVYVLFTLSVPFRYMAEELLQNAIASDKDSERVLRDGCQALPGCEILNVRLGLNEPKDGRGLERWTSFAIVVTARVPVNARKAFLGVATNAFPHGGKAHIRIKLED